MSCLTPYSCLPTQLYADSLRSLANNSLEYDAAMYESLCRVYLSNGKYDVAKLYCDSIAITNTDNDILLNLDAEIALATNDYHRAIESANAVTDKDLYIQAQKAKFLGLAYDKLGDIDHSFIYKKMYESLADSILMIEAGNVNCNIEPFACGSLV